VLLQYGHGARMCDAEDSAALEDEIGAQGIRHAPAQLAAVS
jgi:hypothetical protein